ncbi:hypothetical protein [Devosia sp.]|uniref:hypothetical protein n=1 Tax=Devosia sp. TaxID=1871048 RepID=UPI002FCC3CA7
MMGHAGIRATAILSDRLTFPIFAVSCAVAHMAVFLFSRHLVTGSSVYYFAFAASACFMLTTAFRAQLFSAICLGVFLWLGLWIKFVVHLYNPAVLVEPVGQFDGSIGQYDQVMLIGTAACLAVGLVFAAAIRLGLKTIDLQTTLPSHASRFRLVHFAVWIGVLLVIAFVSVLNVHLGLVRSGLIAQNVLPLKGNAMFSQFLYTGYFFLIAYFLERDLKAGRTMLPGLLAAVIGGALVSISLLSRGMVVFHSMAVLLAVLVLCLRGVPTIRWPMPIIMAALSVASLFVTIDAVEVQRQVAFIEQGADIEQGVDPGEFLSETAGMFSAERTTGTAGAILNLAVGRWLGTEGTMVATGHSDRSLALLAEMMTEMPEVGVPSAYQYIAGSHYTKMTGFQFSTLPGPAGVFYLGGSLGMVFLGLGCLALFAALYEYLAARATGNIFATAFVGVTLANMIAQFGIAPVNLLKALFTLTLLVFVLFVLRRLSLRSAVRNTEISPVRMNL